MDGNNTRSGNKKDFFYLIVYAALAMGRLANDFVFIGSGAVTGNGIIRDAIIIVFAALLLILFIRGAQKKPSGKDDKSWTFMFLLAMAYFFIYNIYLITMSAISAIMYDISGTIPSGTHLAANIVTCAQAAVSAALIVFGIYLFRLFKSKREKIINGIKKYRILFVVHIVVYVAAKIVGELGDGLGARDTFIMVDGGIMILTAIAFTLLINEYLDASAKVGSTFIN